MKTKIIIIIMTVLISTALFSQDIIDPPALQQISNNPNMTPNPNKFILGWNWGNPGKKLDESLGMLHFCNL